MHFGLPLEPPSGDFGRINCYIIPGCWELISHDSFLDASFCLLSAGSGAPWTQKIQLKRCSVVRKYNTHKFDKVCSRDRFYLLFGYLFGNILGKLEAKWRPSSLFLNIENSLKPRCWPGGAGPAMEELGGHLGA